MKSKLLKIVGFGSLAVFMALATLLGCIAIPPAVLASSSQSQSKTLGLNPETDPVVFTTTSGLEIRKSNAQITSTASFTTNRNYSYTQNLTGFYYFTMGTYSGNIYTGTSTTSYFSVSNAPVNWIIIGRGMRFFDSTHLDETTSPAAQAILNDTNEHLRNFFSSGPEGVTQNSEIPENCILAISEKMLGIMYRNSTSSVNTKCNLNHATTWGVVYGSGYYGNRYRYIGSSANDATNGSITYSSNDGSLYNGINNLFSKNASTGAILKNSLGFTQAQADLIKPQRLSTIYRNGSTVYQDTQSTDGATSYTMFPLAYRAQYTALSQNFCIDDYLTTSARRITCFIGSTQTHPYWLRSGSATSNGQASCVLPDGTLGAQNVDLSLGVRPAFVMEFTPNLLN